MSNDEDADEDDRFWAESAVRIQEEPTERVYDLEERTARFGEAIIDFARKIPRNPMTDRLITQLVGCGTSVGANFCEADDAVSRKETARPLWREAKELNLIFAKIYRGKDQ